jgi:hypothetical protein
VGANLTIEEEFSKLKLFQKVSKKLNIFLDYFFQLYKGLSKIIKTKSQKVLSLVLSLALPLKFKV